MPLEVLCHIKYINMLWSQPEARFRLTATFCAEPSPAQWLRLAALLFPHGFLDSCPPYQPGFASCSKATLHLSTISIIHHLSLTRALNQRSEHIKHCHMKPLRKVWLQSNSLCCVLMARAGWLKWKQSPKYPLIIFTTFRLVSKLEKVVSAPGYF